LTFWFEKDLSKHVINYGILAVCGEMSLTAVLIFVKPAEPNLTLPTSLLISIECLNQISCLGKER